MVVFLIFPETKGKTLEEIAHIFGEEVIVADLETMREKVAGQEEDPNEEFKDVRIEEGKKEGQLKAV